MGCEGCARIILLVFNVIFFLVGAASLGVGIWIAIDGDLFLQVLAKVPGSESYGALLSQATYIFIALGGAIFIIAFFGCCGTWKKNKCMLMTYAIIIGVIVLLEVACLVVAYFFYDRIVGVLTSGLAQALNDTYDSKFADAGNGKFTYTTGSLISKGVDSIQIEFSCCGVNNFTDYDNNNFPPTCCPSSLVDKELDDYLKTVWKGTADEYTTSAANCPGNQTYGAEIKGCVDSIKSYVNEKSIMFMAIAGGTVGVQLLLIILSCCVFCAVRKDENMA